MSDTNQRLKQLLNTIKQKPSNFIIGLIVLVILVISIILSIPKSTQDITNINKKSALTKIKELFSGNKEEDIVEPNIYVVKEGDHLWRISEDAYGSGYNAYDIAKANNLNDANLIEVGQELILPEVEPKDPTVIADNPEEVTENAIPTQYTVVSGDHLWGIAQKVYGNPYMWLDISIANNLVNPSVIEVGQVLTLP